MMKLLRWALGFGAAVTFILFVLAQAFGDKVACVLLWQTCLVVYPLFHPRPSIHMHPAVIPLGLILSVVTYALAAYVVLLFTMKPPEVAGEQARGCGCLTALACTFAVSLLCLLVL
jgi:hypothetical protein